ncbi:aldo/keto reductase [Thermogymnomonas acidicola]|uniref:aldo/keto reductase n=1 Tax=Thermogymnomonas acidicola TaxID=399579 RepID=UPI000A8A7648|nr:aldo/keto reductase [Thermogymnomonas acidicola]
MAFMIGSDKVGEIGFGTWGLGGTSTASYDRDGEHTEIIRYAVEKGGLKMVDTAEMYGGAGHTEELVGRAIKGIPQGGRLRRVQGLANAPALRRRHKGCQGEPEELGLSYIDLYLIHWPNSEVDIAETISAMEKLVDEGVTRYIGVSNFTIDDLEKALPATKRHDIVANQIKYSVFHREPEEKLIPFCRYNKITVIAYSPPLNRGNGLQEHRLAEVASASGMTPPVQAALCYVKRQAMPIPKASRKEHVDEIAGGHRKGAWRGRLQAAQRDLGPHIDPDTVFGFQPQRACGHHVPQVRLGLRYREYLLVYVQTREADAPPLPRDRICHLVRCLLLS